MRRLSGLLAAFLIAASTAPSAAWSSPLDNGNAGDVWVDNVGQPPAPGHEMDPHLGCQDINLWGSGLVDGFGTFTINGWSPSARTGPDYGPSTWAYRLSQTGTQLIAVIDVHALIGEAVQNGDKPLDTQGYHFKLQFSQDPQEHKTFWVQCSPPPSPSPPPAHAHAAPAAAAVAHAHFPAPAAPAGATATAIAVPGRGVTSAGTDVVIPALNPEAPQPPQGAEAPSGPSSAASPLAAATAGAAASARAVVHGLGKGDAITAGSQQPSAPAEIFTQPSA